MTCLKLTLPASGTVPALLTLPQPLTPQTLLELEHAVDRHVGNVGARPVRRWR